jgi:flagellin
MSDLTVGTNVPSLIAQRNYRAATTAAGSSLEKLAVGSRINRGADDPAGLITSEDLSAALAALDAESRAGGRSDAVANVADGALAEVSGLLSDANAAAVANASTAGLSPAEREANQMTIDSALQSVDRIARTTTFNGQNVLDGTMTLSAGGSSLTITSAAPTDLGQVTLDGSPRTLADARSGGALDSSRGNAQGAQQSIQAAIGQIATLRGQIGAFQAHTIAPTARGNAVAAENTAAALSAVRDTDYGAESANLIRARMLQGATLSALTLANTSPSAALGLLGG